MIRKGLCKGSAGTETAIAEWEQHYLLELWDKNIYPNGGNSIPEGKPLGTGKKSEGGFCSLDYYAEYRKADLIERQKRIAALVERHRKS